MLIDRPIDDIMLDIRAEKRPFLAQKGREMPPALYDVPRDIDGEVALRKLTALGVKIDTLTQEQNQYLHG